MKSPQLALVLIAVGSVLGLLSLAWPAAVGGKRAYTDEDALEYQQASLELHNQTHLHIDEASHDGSVDGDGEHMHEHADAPPDDSALKAAQARMDAIESKRDTAIHKGQSTAAVFKWLAILIVAGGIVTHFSTRGPA